MIFIKKKHVKSLKNLDFSKFSLKVNRLLNSTNLVSENKVDSQDFNQSMI